MLRAYAALVLLGIVWGSNFMYMKWATALISPTQTVFVRVFFAFLPLLIVALYTGSMSFKQLYHLKHFIVMSILAAILYYYGIVAGTALLPTSIAGLLSGIIPIFTLLATLIFLREERLSKSIIAGVTLSFLGIILSARPWESTEYISLMGIFWMMVGSLSFGISFVYARYYLLSLNIPSIALATWQLGIAVLILYIFTDFTGITAISSDKHVFLGVIIGLGVIGTGGAFLLYYYIIQKLGPVKASVATYIAPVVAVIIGSIMGENVTIVEWLALALIIGGVIVIQATTLG
ncbi:DMT family transporter [Acinetobacter sp.]|jgi:drug/metabolite transporter (DMT)-like permease|uniref:DMT family transporter n=1 Tax=Acinetobacter sp. TaxID=472 RepID=UPI002833C3DC|nr:DMT family transporter [Acinetobacter sp.]MDR0236842.1 DMT family transporter [Acinetobacter sp.]